MPKVDFDLAIANLLQRETRFAPEAYALVRDALHATMAEHSQEHQAEATHLRGPDLLKGFRTYLLKQYGPMVPTLLANWGITCTKDVGEIVFHLIEEGIFSKSEDDRIEDFENVYDFHTAFVAPFLPGGFTPMSASS